MTIEQEFSKLNYKMQRLKIITIFVQITPFLALNIYWKGGAPSFAIFLSVIFPAVTLIFINNAKKQSVFKYVHFNNLSTPFFLYS